MNFFELKKKAEKDGMDIKTNTKKKDIEAFYANLETPVVEKYNPKEEKSECPLCGMKLYHKMCMKHGRID